MPLSHREPLKSLARVTVLTAKTASPTPAVAAKPVSRRRAPAKKPEPSLTEYIREKYDDDQVLQAFADVIDKNPAMWRLMGQLYNLDIKAGSGLRGWDVKRKNHVREPMITTIEVEIVDLEGTKIVRSS